MSRPQQAARRSRKMAMFTVDSDNNIAAQTAVPADLENAQALVTEAGEARGRVAWLPARGNLEQLRPRGAHKRVPRRVQSSGWYRVDDRAVVPVYVYRPYTHDEVVLRKEGERDGRYIADGNHVRPIRIVHVAPNHLIPGKTQVGPLIPAQSR